MQHDPPLSRDAASAKTNSTLGVALVGGGAWCLSFLQMLVSHRFRRLRARIVAVADPDEEALGMIEARRRGIFTTTDWRELILRPGLHLAIEMSGDPDRLAEMDAEMQPCVRVLDRETSLLLYDILAIEQELEAQDDEVSMTRSLAQALSKATNAGVMVLDPDYRIVSVNDGACRLANITPSDARGRFCFQVSHQSLSPCHSPDTPCPMRETLSTGREAHAIHEHLPADGEPHYCDVSTFPLFNSRGEVVQVLEVFRDITTALSDRMERRTEAIKNDLARLVQEDRLIALGKLVASVAHEINNPIGSILNFTKLMLTILQEGPPPPSKLQNFERWLTLTVREAKRCGVIVSNLLSFAQQQSMESKRLELQELIHQILALTQHRLELNSVELSVELPEEPLEVQGDATQIQQCLTNLVFNGLEAMPEGGTLSVRAGREAGEVWVEIADTGPGIPPEVLPHIFEPFFSTKSEGHGVGLGLSMVHGIVKEHGGRVEVEGGDGQGARFRLFLPELKHKPEETTE